MSTVTHHGLHGEHEVETAYILHSRQRIKVKPGEDRFVLTHTLAYVQGRFCEAEVQDDGSVFLVFNAETEYSAAKMLPDGLALSGYVPPKRAL